MMRMRAWTLGEFLMMFWMWVVMMVAMMVPSVAPMILLHAKVGRSARADGHPAASTGAFAGGYLLAWAGFSFVATLLQWILERTALLSPMMVSASPLLGGLILCLAGAYQFTSLKQACLKHCRAPIQFLSHHWRPGSAGALRMGIEHGAFCIGCCWALMGLLFFGGVMNFLWIVGIAIFVLLEKVLPAGIRAGRATGMVLMFSGSIVITIGVLS